MYGLAGNALGVQIRHIRRQYRGSFGHPHALEHAAAAGADTRNTRLCVGGIWTFCRMLVAAGAYTDTHA